MVVLIIGLVLFLGFHLIRVFAPGWRDARIAAMGINAWKGLYSLASAGGLGLIVYGYYLARPNAVELYPQFSEMYHAALVMLALVMILLTAAELPTGHITKKFRHPMLLATVLWSIAHLWMNGDSASVVLFGSFLVWAIIVLRASAKRQKSERPVPNGRNDLIALVVGLAVFGLFWWKLHLWLIGVMPIV